MVLLNRLPRVLLFGAVAVYLLLPVAAVLLYSLATTWTTNLLPDGFTLASWANAARDPRMLAAIGRTLALALAVLALDMLLVVPACFWQRTRNPRVRPLVELCAAIPFVLPFVVIAYGILRVGGWATPGLLGTPLLLLLGHAAIAFPFLYWAVDGAMAAEDVAMLDEAAATCGASPLQTLLLVVLPAIGPGMASGAMLVFATSFGEFALVQILAGARFETVSLYGFDLLVRTSADFGALAVLTAVSFLVVGLVAVAAVRIGGGMDARSGAAAGVTTR